jgi:SAM-dependent methyltransferase
MTNPSITKTTRQIAKGYDAIAPHMELYPAFYQFLAEACDLYHIAKDASIVDVGCGTGRLLAELAQRGYQNLSAVDLSARCVDLARAKVPTAMIRVHDIQSGPLWQRFDVVFMTDVIEHLTDPVRGLKHVHDSLIEGGWLFVSFPNRLAFFPWYYLKPLGDALRWWPWLQGWVRWFTLPYEMRSQQPIDHAYSPGEVTSLLQTAGFFIVRARGMRLLPMLRIPGLDWTERSMAAAERILRRLAPTWVYYRYMLVCQKPSGHS